MNREQLAKYRQTLIEEVKTLLPKSQEYVSISLPYLASIKYIDEGGRLSYFTDRDGPYDMRLSYIFELPTDSLVELVDALKQRQERLAGHAQ